MRNCGDHDGCVIRNAPKISLSGEDFATYVREVGAALAKDPRRLAVVFTWDGVRPHRSDAVREAVRDCAQGGVRVVDVVVSPPQMTAYLQLLDVYVFRRLKARYLFHATAMAFLHFQRFRLPPSTLSISGGCSACSWVVSFALAQILGRDRI